MVVYTTKKFTAVRPIDGIMSMKPTHSPSAPIKPHKNSEHHQVGTWTPKCTRWNRKPEKSTTPSFEILDSVIENYWKLQLICFLGLSINWDIYFDFLYEYISCTVFFLLIDETNLEGTHMMNRKKWIV